MHKFLLLVCLIALSSCYQMPGEDDYCLIPCTNNPSITKEKANTSMAPGGSY